MFILYCSNHNINDLQINKNSNLRFKIYHGSISSLFWISSLYSGSLFFNMIILFASSTLSLIACILGILNNFLTNEGVHFISFILLTISGSIIILISALASYIHISNKLFGGAVPTETINALLIKRYFLNVDEGMCAYKGRLENILVNLKQPIPQIINSLISAKFSDFLLFMYILSIVAYITSLYPALFVDEKQVNGKYYLDEANEIKAYRKKNIIDLAYTLLVFAMATLGIILHYNNSQFFQESFKKFHINNKLQYDEIIQILPILRTFNRIDKYLNNQENDSSYIYKLSFLFELLSEKIISSSIIILLIIKYLYPGLKNMLDNESTNVNHFENNLMFIILFAILNINQINRSDVKTMVIWKFCFNLVPMKNDANCIAFKRDEFIKSIRFENANIGYADHNNGIYTNIINIAPEESFEITSGNIYYLKGQSGSGKTTLIRALGGKAKFSPEKGKERQAIVITNKEREVPFDKIHKLVVSDDVIIAAQENNFPKYPVTVLQYLQSFPDLFFIKVNVMSEVAQAIGLSEEFLNKNIGSSGFYLSIQEAALLKTLALLLRAYFGSSNTKVSILIFDEIFDCISNSTDISSNYETKNENVERILKYIQLMNVDHEKIIIICGHNEKLITSFCNKVIEIKNGEGTISNLKKEGKND